MRFPKQLLKSMYTKNTSHRSQMHACGPSTLRTEMRALQTRQRARRRCPSDKHSVSTCNAYMLMDDLVAQFQNQSVCAPHTVPFVSAQTLRTCIGFANGLSSNIFCNTWMLPVRTQEKLSCVHTNMLAQKRQTHGSAGLLGVHMNFIYTTAPSRTVLRSCNPNPTPPSLSHSIPSIDLTLSRAQHTVIGSSVRVNLCYV